MLYSISFGAAIFTRMTPLIENGKCVPEEIEDDNSSSRIGPAGLITGGLHGARRILIAGGIRSSHEA